MTTTPERYEDRPSRLSLTHVRMPPGCAPSARPERPFMVHAAYYRQGNKTNNAVKTSILCLWHFDYKMVVQFAWRLSKHKMRTVHIQTLCC